MEPTTEQAPLSTELLDKVNGFEGRIRLNPDKPFNYLQLAQLYSEAGRNDLAIATLERFLTIDPKNITIKTRIDVLRGTKHASIATPTPSTPTKLTATQRAKKRKTALRAKQLRYGLAAVGVLLVLLIARPFVFPAERPLFVETFANTTPVWAPKGARVAYREHNDGVKLIVHDLDRDKRVELAETYGSFAWSPDGTKLAYEDDADEPDLWGAAIFVVYAIGGEPKRVAMGSGPSWAPDGSSIAFQCTGQDKKRQRLSTICRVDVATLEMTQILDEEASEPKYSPDGFTIAFTRHEWPDSDDLQGYADRGGRTLADLAEDSLSGGAGTISEANRGMTSELEKERYQSGGSGYSIGKRNVFVVSSSGLGLKQLTTSDNAMAPFWSPDGRWLYYVIDGSDGLELWRSKADGTDQQRAMSGPVALAEPTGIRLTGDGARILFRGKVEVKNEGLVETMTRAAAVDIYVVGVGGDDPDRLETRHAFKQDFTVSPNGKTVVYEYTNPDTGTTELWTTSP